MVGPFTVLEANLPVPDLLDGAGHLLLADNAFYDTFSNDALRLWCHRNARYGIPTVELIGWLKWKIGKRYAIEIGSGYGDLAYHLGIQATDNWCQDFPDVAFQYDATFQPRIRYPSWVEKIDAVEAVRKYRPEVVVASWVTQWIDPSEPFPPGGGSVYGIKEQEMLDAGVTYILVGNSTIHGQKEIMQRPHEEFALPFLRSRSSVPEENRVWIWGDGQTPPAHSGHTPAPSDSSL